MLRARKPLAVLCIAIVVFAAFLPGAAVYFDATFTPLWLVVPDILVVILRRAALGCAEQPTSLLSLVSSRAPPVSFVLA